MPALNRCTSKPMLESLEDRFMPSASPWTMLAQPMLNAMAAETAMVRTCTPMQIIAQAHQRQAFQQDPAFYVGIRMPANIIVKEGETLGQALNRLANPDFVLWRDPRLQTKDYRIQFQYIVTDGRTWVDAPMTASGKGFWENIRTDPKFDPLPSTYFFKINVRARVTDLQGTPVTNWFESLAWSNVYRN